ncbi:MAG TPA: rhodanese-like domain-containing protein [Candidatus Saccharimonadales bacterium]|nr:rhodanese-like domain-containing protein [Candidatus Saccharimonadales bacterium]
MKIYKIKILKLYTMVFLIICMHQHLKSQLQSVFTNMPLISAQQLQEEMQSLQTNGTLKRKSCKNADLLVINVLSRAVCVDCQIPGSINIPLHKLPKKSQEWRKDLNIVLHCASLHCPLSTYAFDLLRKLGFTNVRVLSGGLQEWACKSFPRTGRCRAGYLRF